VTTFVGAGYVLQQVEEINAEPAVGLSLEGAMFGRYSKASLMSFATPSCAFLFDIYSLGEAAFDNGLRDILESEKIEKVIHNCRLVSDCLHHKHRTTICSVFDTQVSRVGKVLKGMFGNTDLSCKLRGKIRQCVLELPSCHSVAEV
jgi:exonuclease 3'-5' domain-containing protein 1